MAMRSFEPVSVFIVDRVEKPINFSLTNLTSILCGFPGVCQGSTSDIYQKCFNTSLLDCPECGKVLGSIFLIFAVCLAVAIFVGNTLIICVGYKRYKQNKLSTMDICRSSMATADMMTGIQMLVVTIYNFAWSMNLSAYELDLQQLSLWKSPQAFTAGIFFLLGITSSLYHILYIGFQRVYGVWKPFSYKFQSRISVYIGLTIVWSLSLMAASVPAWFPTKIAYTYFPSSFLFSPTFIKTTSYQDFTPAVIVLVLFYILPYIVLIGVVVAAGIINGRRRKPRSTAKKRILPANGSLALQQAYFTITLVPCIIVTTLHYSGNLDCSYVSQAYLACVYIRNTYSVFNVFLYNVRSDDIHADMMELIKIRNLKQKPVGLPSATGKTRQLNFELTAGKNSNSGFKSEPTAHSKEDTIQQQNKNS